jgi:hypothetical protein
MSVQVRGVCESGMNMTRDTQECGWVQFDKIDVMTYIT